MATTALNRSVYPAYIYERPSRSRKITGEQWQRVAVFGTSNAAVGNEVAVSFDAIADPGMSGEVRLVTSTGQTSNPAIVQGALINGIVGFISIVNDAPSYVYLEARGQVGIGGGIQVMDANLIDVFNVDPALIPGPIYPPGYSALAGADMSISVADVTGFQGDTVQVVAQYTNNGPDVSDAFNVLVEIPDDSTLNVGQSTAGAVVAGGNVRVPVSGPVSAAGSGSVTVAFDVAGGATIQNDTLDASIADQVAADPVVGNDSTTYVFTVRGPIVADLAVSATSPNGEQGQTGTVSVNVNNTGPDTSGTYAMDIDIPTDCTFNAAASTAGGTVNGTKVEYNGTALANGATGNFNVVFNIGAAAVIGPQSLAVAIFNQSETDDDNGNDSATSTFTISAPGAGLPPSITGTTTGGQSAATRFHAFDVPNTATNGDLILAFISSTDQTSFTPPNNWTLLAEFDNPAGGTLAIIGKISQAGSEAGQTFTPVNTNPGMESAYICHVIDGNSGGLVLGTDIEISSVVFGTTSSVNPPNVAASWGSDDNLFIAVGATADDDVAVNAYPSGYTHTQHSSVSGAGNGTGTTVASCSRQLTAASSDPSLFSLSAAQESAGVTLAIKPA